MKLRIDDAIDYVHNAHAHAVDALQELGKATNAIEYALMVAPHTTDRIDNSRAVMTTYATIARLADSMLSIVTQLDTLAVQIDNERN